MAPQDFAAARLNMVENQVRTNDVTDLAIQDAMRVVAREELCPPERRYLAYAEAPVEYAPGWFMMQPRDVAKLLQALVPLPGERALAIAAPYAAAVLKEMGLSVDELPAGADLRADISSGPYAVMICEASVARAPANWTAALGSGGRLALVERTGPCGRAALYLRDESGGLARRDVFDATPPFAPGFEPARAFAF